MADERGLVGQAGEDVGAELGGAGFLGQAEGLDEVALGERVLAVVVGHPAEEVQLLASALIRKGLSVEVLQARPGHASAVETLDVYGHLWPDDEDRTRQAVDEVLGGELAEDWLRTEAGE